MDIERATSTNDDDLDGATVKSGDTNGSSKSKNSNELAGHNGMQRSRRLVLMSLLLLAALVGYLTYTLSNNQEVRQFEDDVSCCLRRMRAERYSSYGHFVPHKAEFFSNSTMPWQKKFWKSLPLELVVSLEQSRQWELLPPQSQLLPTRLGLL